MVLGSIQEENHNRKAFEIAFKPTHQDSLYHPQSNPLPHKTHKTLVTNQLKHTTKVLG